VEIVITTEPEITNLASLPGPVSSYKQTGSAVPRKKPVRRTVGGSSFTNAPLLTAGSYNDAPAVGESVFYRVRLETGQRLRTSVTAPSNRDGWDLSNTETVTVAAVVYTPSRVPQARQSGVLQGDSREKLTVHSPEVRVRNREIVHGGLVTTEGEALPRASYASVAGDYYVSVQVRQTTPDTSGRVLPIRLDLAVEGTPEGQPVYATAPSPSPSASAPSPGSTAEPTASAGTETPPSDDAGPGVGQLVIAAGVGAGVVALLGLVVGLAIRRSRSSRSAANRNG
jgi:Ca-activated chloride channel family protein